MITGFYCKRSTKQQIKLYVSGGSRKYDFVTHTEDHVSIKMVELNSMLTEPHIKLNS